MIERDFRDCFACGLRIEGPAIVAVMPDAETETDGLYLHPACAGSLGRRLVQGAENHFSRLEEEPCG